LVLDHFFDEGALGQLEVSTKDHLRNFVVGRALNNLIAKVRREQLFKIFSRRFCRAGWSIDLDFS